MKKGETPSGPSPPSAEEKQQKTVNFQRRFYDFAGEIEDAATIPMPVLQKRP